jgi:very-long-chain enoyl-CoA reductase
MSKPLTLQIRPRGKPIRKLPEDLSTSSTTTTATLYSQLSQATSYSVHQLRITKGSDGSVIPNSTSISLSSLGLRDQSQIMVKDLGPQIAWRTVFLIEYLGPILIHPLIYLARPYIYPHATKDPSALQTYTMSLIVLHFLKREFETIFIHKFSAATMPLRNIFKNCAHYWLLAGANIAAWIYAPTSPTAAQHANFLLLYTGLALYTIGELGNLSVHYTLAKLRSPGGTERGIPRGFLFDLVTCPNYFTETLSWIGVYFVSGLSWSVLVFAIASVGQMALWAKKKEMRYRKEFPGKYQKKRFYMFPGIY